MKSFVRVVLAGAMLGVLAVLGCDLSPTTEDRGPPPTSQYYSTPSVNGGGSDAGSGGLPDGGVGIHDFYISISNLTFAPDNLTVTPGSTVHIQNLDGFSHTVTSTTASGLFSPGAVNGVSFDTGAVRTNTSFVIPETAPPGTVIPYFCRIHTSMMVNRPTITIQ